MRAGSDEPAFGAGVGDCEPSRPAVSCAVQALRTPKQRLVLTISLSRIQLCKFPVTRLLTLSQAVLQFQHDQKLQA